MSDLQWLDAQRGTASTGLPSDRMVTSQYPLGTRGPACPPSGGWPAGGALAPPSVAQAATPKTTATNTTRMTCVHHLDEVFQVYRIPASS
jgi:hypothetical protein